MKRVLPFVLLVGACAHQAAPQPVVVPPSPAQPAVAHPDPAAPPVVIEAPRVPRDHDIPAEDTPRPFVLPKPERARLACGAELLVVHRPRLPVATILAVWPVGATADPAGRTGLAAFAADLLTDGAGKRTSLEVATEADRLGVRLTSEASWDSTDVALTTLTEKLGPSLALFADVLLRPRFDADEIERVRNEARTRLLQLHDQASTQAALVGARAVYGKDHRYGQLAQGSAAGLAAITRDDLTTWHRDRLPLSAATIIAVGDVDLKSLRVRLDRVLGRNMGKPKGAAASTPVASPKLMRQVVLVDRPGAAQTEVRAFEPGPPHSSPEYFALSVLNTIFGGNFSSRLNGKLREEKGYTYGARSEFAFRRDGGPFSAGAPVKTAVTRAALVDFLAELDRLRGGDVNDTELTLAKQTMQRSLARQFETPPQIASSLAAIEVFGLPDDYFTTYAAKIGAVTAADIARAAAALHPSDMALVFVGDEKLIGPDIKAVLGRYTRVTP
ncbi:MAG: pitrilysin family protein [Polyangia bacterium]